MNQHATKLSHLDPFADARAARLLESLDRQVEEASQPSGGWHPVSTAPRDGSPVLVWAQWKNVPAGPAIAQWVPRRKEWKRLGETRSIANGIITHWMPVPSAPDA